MQHNIIVHPLVKGGKRKIEVDGVLFESRNEMMNFYNLCENDIYQFKKNYGYEEAISMAIEYRKKQDIKNKKRHENSWKNFEEYVQKSNAKKEKAKFTYWGKTFRDFKECVQYCEKYFFDDEYFSYRVSWERYSVLNADAIKTQAKKKNIPLQKQLNYTLKRKILNGKKARTYDKKYAYCYFNTEEKAIKYLSYKVNDSVHYVGQVNNRIKHIVRYVPKGGINK